MYNLQAWICIRLSSNRKDAYCRAHSREASLIGFLVRWYKHELFTVKVNFKHLLIKKKKMFVLWWSGSGLEAKEQMLHWISPNSPIYSWLINMYLISSISKQKYRKGKLRFYRELCAVRNCWIPTGTSWWSWLWLLQSMIVIPPEGPRRLSETSKKWLSSVLRKEYARSA